MMALLFVASVFIHCTSKGDLTGLAENQDSLVFEKIEKGFVNPADDNVLWCYWYWIGDDISKEGITKDLEAMKKAGIGGVFIGNINPEEKDLWRQIKITLPACPDCQLSYRRGFFFHATEKK